MINETLIPYVGVITDIRKDTPDVKTFRVVGTDGKKLFQHMPGQCAMVSIPGVGECMFSITSSPTNEEYMEFSIKKCGCVTEVLHALEVGAQVTVRGPYGKNFPVEEDFKGKDLLFIAGGIGLAPLRSVINYVRHYRENYGKVVIVSVEDVHYGGKATTCTGMKLTELADFMRYFGCYDAANFDGGGSSQLVARNSVNSDFVVKTKSSDTNSTSVTSTRAVINSILVTTK